MRKNITAEKIDNINARKYNCTVKSYKTGEIKQIILEFGQFASYIMENDSDITKAVPID